MADSTDLVSTFNLSQIDTDHLARQALTLFRKRYSMLYDSHFEVVDIDKKGYVTREKKYEFLMKYTPAESLEKSKELVEKTWLALVGGWKDVLQVNREQVIDLCIRGYHSKDKNHTKYLEGLTKTINKYHFDLMDTNHDGIISKEEFISWVQSRGFGDHWQDAFSALDLNGDGKIDRQEFLKCNLGFCFNIDEDRYNHFFGVVKD